MYKKYVGLALLVLAAGCHRTPTEAPTGQVIANVDGHEITQQDLQAEIGDLSAVTDMAARKSVEQNALQQIVARQIVADFAKEKKLDQTPLAAILRQRAEQEALVGLVERQVRQDVPAPSAEEAQIYVSDHPSLFAQRRILLVDQVIARDVPATLQKPLGDISTLAEAQALLDGEKVKWSQTVGAIDTLAIDPDAAEKVAQLPPGAMFISPEGPITRINHIRDIQTLPVTGDDAVRLARANLQQQRTTDLLQRQLAAIVSAGMSKVRYNAAYKPAQPLAMTAAQGGQGQGRNQQGQPGQ